ncbi:MAG: hypothetical protein IKN21_05570, partial [Prevotella sp.]|nr:hypothetical protein [Prevotella sp.]
GARREVVEAYIQRLNKLEDMAMSYQGVVKTYAIQAGRELPLALQFAQLGNLHGAEGLSALHPRQSRLGESRS